jgi:hypothetical protein
MVLHDVERETYLVLDDLGVQAMVLRPTSAK